MSRKWGYWSDLLSLQLADGENTALWIQAMPLGEYEHPVYGTINITSERVQRFAQNVKKNVRDQQLDIDYDHKQYSGEAAGWVTDAEARADGLWLLVDWTQKAWDAIKSKAYRYFSPEYDEEWTHPKSGEKFKDVLFGGALTNRPFLKDILAINMSEVFEQQLRMPAPPAPPVPAPKGGQVDPKAFLKLIGLGEDATDEQVTTKLTELVKGTGAPPTPPTPPAPTPPTPPAGDPPAPSLTDPPATPDEVAALVQRLADVDGNPALKALTELVQVQQRQLSAMAKREREQLVDKRLSDLDGLMKDKHLAVPPAVKDQLREILIKSPAQLGEEVYQAYRRTLELGLIDMTERGWQRRTDSQSPTEKYLTEIDRVMTEAKQAGRELTYAMAAARVSAANPELAQQYREESYIPEGR